MFPSPEEVFRDFAEFADDFKVIRNKETVAKVKGFLSSKTLSIQLNSAFKIEKNDILYHIISDTNYYVKQAVMTSSSNKNYGYKASCVLDPTLLEERGEVSKNSYVNIHTIHGNAVIGNQNTTTIITENSMDELKSIIASKTKEDQEILNKLLNRLEIIKEDNQPISKGTLAKFSDALAKHSDIAIVAGKILLEWLSGKN